LLAAFSWNGNVLILPFDPIVSVNGATELFCGR
jgi:hypothetical protein